MDGDPVVVVLVAGALGGARRDEQVVAVDQGGVVLEPLAGAGPAGDAAGGEPVQRVEAVEQHEEAALVAGASGEAAFGHGPPPLDVLGPRRQVHRRPVVAVGPVADDVEVDVAREGVELGEAQIQLPALVLQVADGAQVGRGLPVDPQPDVDPDPPVHEDHVGLEPVVAHVRGLVAEARRPAGSRVLEGGIDLLRQAQAQAGRRAGIGEGGGDAPRRGVHQVLGAEVAGDGGDPRADAVEVTRLVGGSEAPVEGVAADSVGGEGVPVAAPEEDHGIAPGGALVVAGRQQDVPAAAAVAQQVEPAPVHEDEAVANPRPALAAPGPPVVVADPEAGPQLLVGVPRQAVEAREQGEAAQQPAAGQAHQGGGRAVDLRVGEAADLGVVLGQGLRPAVGGDVGHGLPLPVAWARPGNQSPRGAIESRPSGWGRT